MRNDGVCLYVKSDDTHFPYSSLLNFGRGEGPRLLTNGFNSCPVLCVSAALLNIATFDDSGESYNGKVPTMVDREGEK